MRIFKNSDKDLIKITVRILKESMRIFKNPDKDPFKITVRILSRSLKDPHKTLEDLQGS